MTGSEYIAEHDQSSIRNRQNCESQYKILTLLSITINTSTWDKQECIED